MYDEGEQRAFIHTLVENVLNENYELVNETAEGSGEDEDPPPPGGNLVPYLYRYAPLIKHKAFEEEREWRIISRPLSVRNSSFAYRPGASMLIPYCKIPLDGPDAPFSIEEIIVGPTPNSDLSVRSVQSLLRKHGLSTARVSKSGAPYRSW